MMQQRSKPTLITETMELTEALQQARANYLRVIEAGDFDYYTLGKAHVEFGLCSHFEDLFPELYSGIQELYFDFSDKIGANAYYKPRPFSGNTPEQNKQALLDRVELIDLLLKEIE